MEHQQETMDPVYSQLSTYPDNGYMTVDNNNYSMYWDYNNYNTGYVDPGNQDYYHGQYNMDLNLPYTDDVMGSWDIPSPCSDTENDCRYLNPMERQMSGFSPSTEHLSSLDHQVNSPNSSLGTGSDTTTEDYMLKDKCGGVGRKLTKVKGPLRKVHQRHAANVRERRRMRTINDAFEHLRQRVPDASDDKKTSKVDTLKLAVKYINDLTDILKSCGETNFPGLRKGQGNKKVVVSYSMPEFDPTTGDIVSGHSLSWVDNRDPKLTGDSLMRTKLWIPHLPTKEDLKAIEADGGHVKS